MSAEPEPNPELQGGDFTLFVTRLSFQGLLACGVLENPITQEKRVNLPGARMVRDDLVMLASKTRGQLDRDEEEHLERVIRDLCAVLETLEAGS